MILNSDYTPVAATASIGLAQHNAFRVHIGVRFYNDQGNGVFTEVEPTAGSIDIKVAKPTIRGDKAVGTITANDKSADLVFDGPVTQVTGAKNVAVTGATHFKLVVCTEK
uniref:DUF7265 domain-containing protein n=1 Tax=Pseudomonas phage Cygsa01 TaxID=3138529 RepID=A0AAU6W3P0_9VIRU